METRANVLEENVKSLRADFVDFQRTLLAKIDNVERLTAKAANDLLAHTIKDEARLELIVSFKPFVLRGLYTLGGLIISTAIATFVAISKGII